MLETPEYNEWNTTTNSNHHLNAKTNVIELAALSVNKTWTLKASQKWTLCHFLKNIMNGRGVPNKVDKVFFSA